MKKITILSFILLVFLIVQNDLTFANKMPEYFFYNSMSIERNNEFIMLNIDIKKYQYEEIYQYLIIDSQTLFVFGISNDNGPMKISSINLKTYESVLIKQYPPDLSWAAKELKFYLLKIKKADSVLSYIFLEYIDGNVARNIDERESHLNILCSVNNKQYQLIGSEKLAENSIVYIIQTEPEDKYLYLTVNNTQRNDYVISPARLETAKIQFSDCNWDGYPDIVIWKTVSFSRLIKGKDKEDFIYDHEELSVMYFQPQEMTFSKPMPIKWQ